MKRESLSPTTKSKKFKQTTLKPIKEFIQEIPKRIQLDENCFLRFWRKFLPLEESNTIFQKLLELPFEKVSTVMYDKAMDYPRLFVVMTEENLKSDQYSLKKINYTKEVLYLKEKIEKETNSKFNFVLIQLYRNGDDHISFHSDREVIPGNSIIASLSFGETRRFVMKNIKNENIKKEFDLINGSLITMEGETQIFWKHSIPKQKKVKNPRINLTFRIV